MRFEEEYQPQDRIICSFFAAAIPAVIALAAGAAAAAGTAAGGGSAAAAGSGGSGAGASVAGAGTRAVASGDYNQRSGISAGSVPAPAGESVLGGFMQRRRPGAGGSGGF
jgi:hypothetical protein